MGPPLFSGGNVPVRDGGDLHFLLQWGRRCSAAEITQGEANKPWQEQLQWGRRCSAAEITPCRRAPTRGPARFNGAAAVQRRKCGARRSRCARDAALQWGRRCSAAEIVLYQPCLPANSMLQWGRRCSAAEIQKAGWARIMFKGGFNGAAAVQRRKWAMPSAFLMGALSFNGAAAVQRRK